MGCDEFGEVFGDVGERGRGGFGRSGRAGDFVNGGFQNRKLVGVNLSDGVLRQAEGGEFFLAVGRQAADKLLNVADYTIVAGDFAVDNDAKLVGLPVFQGGDIFLKSVGVKPVLAENKLDLVGADLISGFNGGFGHGISVTLKLALDIVGVFGIGLY